jgi:hypothetical protein
MSDNALKAERERERQRVRVTAAVKFESDALWDKTDRQNAMLVPPANPGPRVRPLIDVVHDSSLSALEKLRLFEEVIATKPPHDNLPFVRAWTERLRQMAVAEVDDRARKIGAMLSPRTRRS